MLNQHGIYLNTREKTLFKNRLQEWMTKNTWEATENRKGKEPLKSM
jgi:hypothetical protein